MKNIFLLTLAYFLANVVLSQNAVTFSAQSAVALDKYPVIVKEINFGPELQAQFDKRDLNI